MNLTKYQPLALRTEKKLPTPIDRLVHAALGIDTETGELNTIIKRVKIYGKDADSVDTKGVSLRQHAAEEVADVCWYIAIACDALQAQMDTLAPIHAGMRMPLESIALGTACYSGKIADIILFAKDRGHVAPLPHDRNFILNSMANLLRLLYAACATFELDLDALLEANIAKLRERFPDAYSDEAAEARADKGGLDARNS